MVRIAIELMQTEDKNVRIEKYFEKLNHVLDDVTKPNGTIGKLLNDEKLYNELVQTNKSLQNLVQDLEKHPER